MIIKGEKMDGSITPTKYLFATLDCMGNKVALKKETYEYKLLSSHKEVTPNLMKVGVESPHTVFIDEIPNRYDYYKLITNPVEGKDNLLLLKVVVEATENEYAEIVTTYLTRRIKEETTSGRLIYDATSNRSGIQFQI